MPPEDYSESIEIVSTAIDQEFVDIGRLLVAASVPGTRARTVYYKAAYNSAASIVEGMVYLIVIDLYRAKRNLFGMQPSTKMLHELNAGKLGSDKVLFIGEKLSRPVTPNSLKDKFSDMNDFCRRNKVIDDNLFEKLDRIRKKRNQVHLQARTSTARNYTRSQVNQVTETADELLDIYLSI